MSLGDFIIRIGIMVLFFFGFTLAMIYGTGNYTGIDWLDRLVCNLVEEDDS